MYSLSTIASLAALLSTALAIAAPQVPGFTASWVEEFAGSEVNTGNWEYWTLTPTNGELETYPLSGVNCQITTSQTLTITPENTNGQWTSCRIETNQAFVANATNGLKMLVQASLKIGEPGVTPTQLQGIWPAFWSLGQGVKNNVPWPACGEIDTFENVDGIPTGFGTLHCGNACLDNHNSEGITAGVPFDYGTFHTWAHEVDLTNTDWTAQTITFLLDGTPYRDIQGSDVGDLAAWTALTGPMMVTLNVAVGGAWPKAPSASTVSGAMAGMEVQYVAVYHTN
jgi:beta-glucanase (GH16 family)